MALKVFENLLKDAIASGIDIKNRDAIHWLKNKAASQKIAPGNLFKDTDRLKTKLAYGHMYFFRYDAKWKEDLEYWDRFPVIFAVQKYRHGFSGINLHYLNYGYRAKLLDALWDIQNNTRMNETTKIIASYKILDSAAKFKYFRPCYKNYLYDHVASKFIKIDACEWSISAMLPVERFAKKSKEYVWRDGLRQF